MRHDTRSLRRSAFFAALVLSVGGQALADPPPKAEGQAHANESAEAPAGNSAPWGGAAQPGWAGEGKADAASASGAAPSGAQVAASGASAAGSSGSVSASSAPSAASGASSASGAAVAASGANELKNVGFQGGNSSGIWGESAGTGTGGGGGGGTSNRGATTEVVVGGGSKGSEVSLGGIADVNGATTDGAETLFKIVSQGYASWYESLKAQRPVTH